jgi:DNA-binding response OmpR family regulator
MRILVVHDDEDTRDLMTFALESHQYEVTRAASGPAALEALRAGTFDLVITDYDMPGLTGAEMLKRAGADDLMGGASALVITAHPDPRGIPDDTPMLQKPIDIERLLVQVRAILPSGAGARTPRKKPPVPAKTGALLDLVLYVSSRSPASLKARRRMDEVLAEFDAGRIRFEVCDLFQHAASAEKDRVVFTPTLVKRSPAPKAWILGDLSTDDVVRDLLTMCGVPPRR